MLKKNVFQRTYLRLIRNYSFYYTIDFIGFKVISFHLGATKNRFFVYFKSYFSKKLNLLLENETNHMIFMTVLLLKLCLLKF